MSLVVIGCEFSGIVRDAFRDAGHEAISVDLLPTERPGLTISGRRNHWQGDVLDVLAMLREEGTTVSLGIFHPPCTYLSNSGVRWLYGGKGREPDLDRWHKMEEAATFFAACLNAPVGRVAVENPIMHGIGRELVEEQVTRPFERYRVQPYEFGTPETKATILWTRGLPILEPTNIVDGRTPRVHYASPGPNRWKERSRTDPNLATAMAEQWGDLT